MKKIVMGFLAIAAAVGCSSQPKPEATVQSPAPAAFPTYEEAGYLTWKNTRGPASNERCRSAVERIQEAGCYLSKNNADRIKENGDICRHLESGSGKTEMEVILLKDSDKVVTVATKGANRDGNWCPTVKYDVDHSGIKEVKVIKNKTFMLSKDGQVYFMYTDGQFYELLTSDRNSYKGVKDIKGINNGTGVELVMHSGRPVKIDEDKFADKISAGQARKIKFHNLSTNESLFRDR